MPTLFCSLPSPWCPMVTSQWAKTTRWVLLAVGRLHLCTNPNRYNHLPSLLHLLPVARNPPNSPCRLSRQPPPRLNISRASSLCLRVLLTLPYNPRYPLPRMAYPRKVTFMYVMYSLCILLHILCNVMYTFITSI